MSEQEWQRLAQKQVHALVAAGEANDRLEARVKELEEQVAALIRAGDRFVLEPVRWVDNKIEWNRVTAMARVAGPALSGYPRRWESPGSSVPGSKNGNAPRSERSRVAPQEQPQASRRAEIARAYVHAGGNGAARATGVSKQRVSQAMRSLFAVDGLTPACAERGVDANAVAGVIADAMVADRTLMLPDGTGRGDAAGGGRSSGAAAGGAVADRCRAEAEGA